MPAKEKQLKMTSIRSKQMHCVHVNISREKELGELRDANAKLEKENSKLNESVDQLEPLEKRFDLKCCYVTICHKTQLSV